MGWRERYEWLQSLRRHSAANAERFATSAAILHHRGVSGAASSAGSGARSVPVGFSPDASSGHPTCVGDPVSSRPVEWHTATSWPPAAGYCDVTETGVEGDCSSGASGSWLVGPGSPRGLRSVRQCVAACAACDRCRYLSISLEGRDCSWYHECDLQRLKTAHAVGHLTLELLERGRVRSGQFVLDDAPFVDAAIATMMAMPRRLLYNATLASAALASAALSTASAASSSLHGMKATEGSGGGDGEEEEADEGKEGSEEEHASSTHASSTHTSSSAPTSSTHASATRTSSTHAQGVGREAAYAGPVPNLPWPSSTFHGPPQPSTALLQPSMTFHGPSTPLQVRMAPLHPPWLLRSHQRCGRLLA